ncbi:MAG: T9SS type A sorting domain-containing protein [Candidatus Kapabacteria bacterium]|nr:T9SS type A sorting domain-containing protein [Candidatus Kapabacteria bacterium]
MKKCFLMLLVVLLALSNLFLYSQAPDTMWTRMFKATGGMFSGMAISKFAKQTPDGGFIGIGYSVHPFLMAHIIKTDAIGNKLWQKEYFDNYNKGTLTVSSAAQISDNNYIIAGYGNILQDKGLFLIKIDSNGDTLWTQFYNHQDSIVITKEIKISSDKGFILTGTIAPLINADQANVFFMKTDEYGNMQWSDRFGLENIFDDGYSVEESYDGNYLIAGKTGMPSSEDTIFVIKVGTNGSLIDIKIFGDEPDIKYPSENINLFKTSDRNYMLAGHDGGDIHLIKLDQNLKILWHKVWGSENIETANNIIETRDGGFIAVGKINLEWPPNSGNGKYFPLIVKFNSSGEFVWDKIMYNEFDGDFHSINQNSDGGFIVGGQQKDNQAFDHFYMVRLLGDGNYVNDMNSSDFHLEISPNPVSNDLKIGYNLTKTDKIKISIVDFFGRELMLLKNSINIAGSHYIQTDVSNLLSGIYYFVLKNDEKTIIQKFIVVK